jgi:DNA repair ATPase RecN
MLHFIALENFRSYKEARVDFVPGINALVGPSCNGKSNLIKGINWVRTNRPTGKGYVSFWNRSKHGEPIDATLVRLGLDGKWEVTRLRNSVFNGYLLHHNGNLVKDLEALNSTVPDEISAILNLSDVNIQLQRDLPFLLDGNGGAAARFFNRIIRMDLIDDLLSATDSKHRSIKADIKNAKEKIKTCHAKIKDYSWITPAEQLINNLADLQAQLKSQKVLRGKLWKLLDEIDEEKDIIQRYKFADKADTLLGQIETQKAKISEYKKEKRKLSEILEEYKEYQTQLDEEIDVTAVEKLIVKLEKSFKAIETLKTERAQLKNIIGELTIQEATYTENTHKFIQLKKKLPKVCPLFNKPLEENDLI